LQDARISQVEDLVAQNQKLRDELSVASAALKEAQAEITRLQGVNHSSPSSSFAAVASLPPFSSAKVINYGKGSKKDASSPPLSSPATNKRSNTGKTISLKEASAKLARSFSAGSDIPHGYQYLYYPAGSKRCKVKELRKLFSSMGFNNARILDLQHPTHNILSILVHNDCALEFTTKMHKVTKTDPISDFDPTDPIHLKDPKFSLLSPSLRAQKAKEVQNKRCLRGILFLRRSIRISVARFLCEREFINDRQFNSILTEELNSRNASAPPPSASSKEEREAKRNRLDYLGYLLHLEHDAALALVTVPPVSSGDSDESQMILG
jgi:hypothetical protein